MSWWIVSSWSSEPPKLVFQRCYYLLNACLSLSKISTIKNFTIDSFGRQLSMVETLTTLPSLVVIKLLHSLISRRFFECHLKISLDFFNYFGNSLLLVNKRKTIFTREAIFPEVFVRSDKCFWRAHFFRRTARCGFEEVTFQWYSLTKDVLSITHSVIFIIQQLFNAQMDTSYE